MSDSPEQKYRVRYQDKALPGPSYTRPLTMEQALARKIMMDSTEGVSGAEVLTESAIENERASTFRVEGENKISPEEMLREAETYREAAQNQVAADVDASLEEPTEDTEGENFSLSPYDLWQNRRIALDHAMKLAMTPLGGMIVQTGRMSADDVVACARTFLAFLNEGVEGA